MKWLWPILLTLLVGLPAAGTPDRGMVDHVTNSNTLPCDDGRVGWRIYDLAEAREEYCDGSAWIPSSTWVGGLTSVFDCTGPECNDIDAKAGSILNFSRDGTFNAVENGVELWLPVETDAGTDCYDWLSPGLPPHTPKEGAICLPRSSSSYGSERVLVGRDLSAIPGIPDWDKSAHQDIGGDIHGVFDCWDPTDESGYFLGEAIMDDGYSFGEYSTRACRTMTVPDQSYLDFSTSNPNCDFYNQDNGTVSGVTPAGANCEIDLSAPHEIPVAGTKRTLLYDMTNAAYNGFWTATYVDADTFSIPLAACAPGATTGSYIYYDGDCQPAVVNESFTGLKLPGLYGTDWGLYQWSHHCNNFSNPVLSGTNGVINGPDREGSGQVCYYAHDNDDTPTTVDTQGDENWDRQLWVGNGESAPISSVANDGSGIAEFTTNVSQLFYHRFLPGERVDIIGTTGDVYDGATLTVTSVTGASDNVVQTGQAYVSNATGTMSLNPDRIGGVCQQILWSDEVGNPAGTVYLNLRSHNGSGTPNNEDEFLMAAAVMTGSHLACTATAAPGGVGKQWDITLMSGIEDTSVIDTNVTCSIIDTAVHCVDNDNIAVIPASTIVNPWAIMIKVVGTNAPAAATIDCRVCLTAR